MLYHYKEITIVRLRDFVPEGLTLEEHLGIIEQQALPVTISFDNSYAFDSESKIATLPDGTNIGRVNADGHRYLQSLMAKSEKHTCVGLFSEVIRREGHTPVIIYKVLINLEEVEKLKPGEEWDAWDTSYPVASNLGDIDSVHRLASLLTSELCTGEDKPYFTTLIEKLEQASLYDMSVETTSAYDDLCFLLESHRTPNMKEYKNLLQHATTVRRTDKMRKSFVEKWWPEVLKSESIGKLWNEYLQGLYLKKKIKSDGKISQKLIKDELENIDAELKKLPYKLYLTINNIDELFSGMFYTKIPRVKQKKLLSLMALSNKLQEIQGKKMYKVSNMFVNGMVKMGDNSVIGDIINDNAIKIINSK